MNRESLRGLYKEIGRRFTGEDMDSLCYALNIDRELFPGPGRENKARQLVEYLEDKNRLNELVEICKEEILSVNWDQFIESSQKLSSSIAIIPVKIFFLNCSFCSHETRQLFTKQNRLQDKFLFDIADVERWQERILAEQRLNAFQTTLTPYSTKKDIHDELLRFADCFQEEMVACDQYLDQVKEGQINLAVTETPMPANYYTWNTRDRRGIVIGINSLRTVVETDPQKVNKIILRVAQRMLIYAQRVPDLEVHDPTYGCLFDYTKHLPKIKLLVEDAYFCPRCKELIIEGKGKGFFEYMNDWIANS